MNPPRAQRGGPTTLARWRTGLALLLAALFCGRMLGPRVGAWVVCATAALVAVVLALLDSRRARPSRAGPARSGGRDLLVWALALAVLAVGAAVAGVVGLLA